MNRYFKVALSPVKTSFEAVSRLSPSFYWNRYMATTKSAGFTKLFLALSFDCDTAEDATVVIALDRRLRDMGLNPSYAVPGELLLKNSDIYEKLKDRGASFMNHGYKTHTYWDDEMARYTSCFFYDEISRKQVIEDIRLGHECLERFLGKVPSGFRAPHFGTFQRRSELRFLHSILHDLGYKYSSSTSPIYSLIHGPLFSDFGIREIPVSGVASRPWQIFDSWGFFYAPNRIWNATDYLTQAIKMSKIAKDMKLVGILNYYADPSHVWNQPNFFEALAILTKNAQAVGIDELACLPAL